MDKATGSGSAPRNGTNTKEGTLIKGQDFIRLEATKVLLSKDTPLLTDAQDVAGAINELFSGGGEGGDIDDENYSFMDDPDWQLFKDTPEPASNQLIFAIRVIDPNFRKAGSYCTDWYVTGKDENGNNLYAANQDTKIECNVKIDMPGWENMSSSNVTEWGFISYTIDWGDGSESKFVGGVGALSTLYKGADGFDGGKSTTSCHLYEEAGTYIVTCTFDLNFPSGITAGEYAVRTHNQSQSTNYVSGAPITVFAKVGKAFGCYAANTGLTAAQRQTLPQISKFGMNRTIKFLSGNFAKLGYFNWGNMNSLKYLKTDAIRFFGETYLGNATTRLEGPNDLSLATSYCLEFIEITGQTFSGTCCFKNLSDEMTYINYSTTNEIKLDDEYPAFWGIFRNCYALKKLPQQILDIPAFLQDNVFAYCYSLKSINMPNCVSLGKYAFSYCKSLKKVSLPKLQNITDYCFNECSQLTDLDISKCVSIGNNAFIGCTSLYEFNLKNVETIGGYAFPNGSLSKLKKIVLPKCTSIDNLNFQGSFMLSEFNCPLLTTIPDYAFQNCYSLCIFNVSENCTFGNNVFNNCYGLFPRPDGSTN